jgi:hypothetical protein
MFLNLRNRLHKVNGINSFKKLKHLVKQLLPKIVHLVPKFAPYEFP